MHPQKLQGPAGRQQVGLAARCWTEIGGSAGKAAVALTAVVCRCLHARLCSETGTTEVPESERSIFKGQQALLLSYTCACCVC